MYKKLGAVLVLAMTLVFTSVTAYAQTEGEESVQESESTEAVEEISLEDNPFSEDGNATLGDSATSADDKEFITVTTRDGNIFYLIIDHQRDDNNVYFLNMVDESDLQAFLEENSDTGLESIVSLPAEKETLPETTPETTTESEDIQSEDVVTEGLAQAQSSGNLNYLIVIVLVGVFGAAYYFKIHKKKQQSSYDEYETEEEYEEDEYERDDAEDEGSEYEDEEYEAEDNAAVQVELRARQEQEAERQAKLEEERQEKLEQERIRKEKIKEKQEKLKAESQKLEEEKNRLKEEQRRLEGEQNRINEEQEQLEAGEDGVF